LLENREVQPVGAERPQKVDVVIVAATHQPLEARVDAGTFRRDLYARLATGIVRLPPLRERAEDVFAILQSVASARGESLAASEVEVEVIERLMGEPLLGNVRELAAIYARLRIRDPEPGLRAWALTDELGPAAPATGRSLTRERVDAALAAAGGNESEAARRLAVSRGALRRFLAKT
jgi:transcriptional regulator of acetoin/glycerol metabolism